MIPLHHPSNRNILVNFETQVRVTVHVFSPGLTTDVGERK